MMQKAGIPSGIAALGYTDADIPRMAEAAFAQKRPLAQAPLETTENDLAKIYRRAMRYW
jgi:alcohol dehydrogenase class IV